MSNSNSYIYREDVYDYNGFQDIYISEEVIECTDLGEVSFDGKTGCANIERRTSTNLAFYICKGTEQLEKGLVSGWANVAKNADGSIPLDWQGDVIEPDVLEDAAIEFMKEYQGSGVNHQGDETGRVVESIVLTKDKQAALGIPEGVVPEGWFITVQLYDDDVIEKVKNGEYRMFSIQGTGERVPL